MPKFTLIKQPDHEFDAEVTVTFHTEMLGVAREHFDDFLKASGFEIPLETETEPSDIELWLEKAEDDMWDDAFESKFPLDSSVNPTGSDKIQFPSRY